MKENTKPTQEEKEQYFAAHYGQPVFRLMGLSKLETKPQPPVLDGDYLELTSLADITDEDAIEVAKILRFRGKSSFRDEIVSLFENTDLWLVQHINPFNFLEAYQYLQSKGIALKWRNYSVEQLSSFGWLKLKQKGGEKS